MRTREEWLDELKSLCEMIIPNFRTVHLIDNMLFINGLNSGLRLDPKFDSFLNGKPYFGVPPYNELLSLYTTTIDIYINGEEDWLRRCNEEMDTMGVGQ